MSCLSDLALDRLTGEDAHVLSCATCRERLRLLRDDKARAQVQVSAILQRARSKARRRVPWWMWAPALAVLPFLFLLVPREPDVAIRIKGDATMRFVVQRGAEVMSGTAEARYREGDALRFIVTPAQAEYFLLVGIEANGQVSAYFPFGGVRSEKLSRFKEAVLPGSLVLDASAADEIFLGLFSEAPLEVETVRAALREKTVDDASLRALSLPAEKRWVVIHKGQTE